MTLRKFSAVTPTLFKIVLVYLFQLNPTIPNLLIKTHHQLLCIRSARFNAFTASGLRLISPVGFANVGAFLKLALTFALTQVSEHLLVATNLNWRLF
jgi:hypothetical protein